MAKQISIAAMLMICVCLVTLTAQPVWGQAVYGSIIGTVTDPQGAAVANAKVTVLDQRKGTSDTTTSNDSGNYSVTHLIPDVYTVRVEAPGFKASEQKDVIVSADAAANVPLQFQVGGTSETVEVTAEAPQLKTDRADVATEFNAKQVQDIPNLNRNFTSLQLMAPGSQLMGWGHAATENPQQSQQIVTQGQHFSGTAFELDGTDNQDPILGIIVVNPNLDAVTEAKVALQNYDAEFGKAVGSVVTAQTKSGSNEIHGSGFYFRRTDALQARDPFTQDPGVALPHSRRQQFGGTVGGAVIKNKLFYFADYQGTRQTKGISGRFTMPTANVISTCTPTNTTGAKAGYCDLSDYNNVFTGTNAVTGGGTIFDPATGDSSGANRTRFCGPAGCGTEPNWIPLTAAAAAAEPVGPGGPVKSIASPAALNVLAALPPAQVTGLQNNFVGSGSGPFKQDSFDTRIDYSMSSSINVFGRFSIDYFKLSGTPLLGKLGGPGNGGGDSAPGLAGSSITHNYSLSAGLTKTISSTLLTDVRFGWFKYNPITQKPDGGQPMTAFGIPGANTSDPKTNGLGFFSLGGDPIVGQGCTDNNSSDGCVISSFGDGLGPARCNCPLTESEQQVQFVNNWTKTKGNHIIKFGGDIRYALNLRIPSDNNRTGEYNFSPEATADFTSPTAGGNGLDLATFILGDVTRLVRYVNNPAVPPPAERQKRWFFYGQDTWRANPKLTLSFGLRWEIYFPETVNAKGGGGFANITDLGGTGAIRVAGYGGIGSNGNVKNDWHAFAPRFGIAYEVTPKTVVRMGYGRSYDIGVFGSNFGHTVTQNLPVLLKQNYDVSNFPTLFPGQFGNRKTLFTLDAGPNSVTGIDPATAFPAIPSNGIFPFSSLGGTISGLHIRPPKQTLPRVDAYNATVQRQLTPSISLEVAYVGSKGTHGFTGNNPNYDVNPLSMSLYGVIDPNTITPTNPKGSPYDTNLRRPLCRPVFGGTPGNPQNSCKGITFDLGNYYGNDAASTYNAFEIKMEKRFARGLQFITHYTYSHADGYDSNYYAIDHKIAWGAVDFNRNHEWVFSPVYELPFGKGKQYMGDASRAMDYVVGGWELASNTTWGSGLPWTPGFSNCGSEQDVGVCRPDRGVGSFHTGVSGSISPVNHNLTFYTPVPDITNPANPPGPFADPTKGHLGNIQRNSFVGPRAFTSDLSIVKKIPVFERLNVQFRTDVFNLFNHPVYSNPNTTIDGTGTNDGKITSLQFGYPMRQIQFALRFDF
ncbi:MAG TPA: TonB-dependent receptor [Terriglobales bacterium]|nr:TonB-dependent receptor [Terriglobales bacterium]